MEPAKKHTRPNLIVVVLAAGLIAFILYIVLFVNPTQVVATLSQTNLAIFSIAFVSYMLYTFCASLVWHGLLGSLSVKITRRKAFLFTWVGLFFDATVPQLGWSAEVSKTFFLSKDAQVESGRVGASVVGQKIFTMTTTIVALSTGLGLLLVEYSFPLADALLIGLVLALSVLTLGVVYYVSFKPSATKTLLNWAIRIILFFKKTWNPQGFRVKAEGLLGSFHVGISQLKAKPKALIAPVLFAILSFAFEVSVMFIAFAALGQPVPVDVVLIVFTLTGTLQTVGLSFFGFPQLIMSIIFSALLIDPAVAVSVALLTGVVNLWFRLVVSYGALQWAGIKIMRQTQPKL
jgi:glycosyltransferase 2 family protein